MCEWLSQNWQQGEFSGLFSRKNKTEMSILSILCIYMYVRSFLMNGINNFLTHWTTSIKFGWGCNVIKFYKVSWKEMTWIKRKDSSSTLTEGKAAVGDQCSSEERIHLTHPKWNRASQLPSFLELLILKIILDWSRYLKGWEVESAYCCCCLFGKPITSHNTITSL